MTPIRRKLPPIRKYGCKHGSLPLLGPALWLILLPTLSAARELPAPRPAPDSAHAPSLATASVRPLPSASDSAAKTAPGDTAADSLAMQKKLYEYIAYPFLQMVTFPVEAVLVPVVRGLLYPVKPPLRYFLNENVIDRTIQLISFGPDEKIMLYPTMNLGPNTGSSTGLTFRDRGVFGRPNERLVAQGNIYVNGDWKARSYLSSSDLLGTGVDGKVAAQLVRMKNAQVNQPGTSEFWFYSDTSEVFTFLLSRPLFEKFSAGASFVYRINNFGEAPPQTDSIVSDFFRAPDGQLGLAGRRSRGLDQSWSDRSIGFGLYRDTRNNENITLAGSNFRLDWSYHLTDAGHDFNNWQSEWTGYYKLGKERYEISADEERKAGPLNVQKILEKMEYQKLKEQIFNRKVVALHLYAAQSYEVPGNRMPMYGLQILGNDTPMRGYAGARFRDYTVASAGAEYRFPVMRLVDGVLFDEYGVYGRSWDTIDYWGILKNSWGFGIRVRRPDIFLFRVQLGFHGYQGIEFNMSVDVPY